MAVNKVILLGNVGKEPEIRTFEDGGKVANFSFATSERAYTLANGTNIPERTEWHNIKVSGGLVNIIEKFIHKGDKLYIEGKLRTRSYKDNQDVVRYITEVVAENIEMLGGSSQGSSSPQQQQQQQGQPQQQQQGRQSNSYQQSNNPAPF